VLLFQAATSLSFRFLVVMPFVGFSGITFGESPVKQKKYRCCTIVKMDRVYVLRDKYFQAKVYQGAGRLCISRNDLMENLSRVPT
jgi:hypothetical protein